MLLNTIHNIYDVTVMSMQNKWQNSQLFTVRHC